MIELANILDWCASYNGEPFHALLCDPPYHLTSITERFSSPDAAPAQYGKDGAFQRASKGFMGKDWDGGDLAFQPSTWAALAQHLYPGAFGMAFAGSRGWHRMAVAIEDAGLIIHPTIFCWAYLSGFPKATRIDVQLDRAAGAEREIVGQRKHAPKFDAKRHGYREKDNGYNSREREAFDVTAPATDLAAAWEGHRYGLQALKPAVEPIIVFQKPYQGKPAQCIARTGAGALNIDAGRIGSDAITQHGRTGDQFGFASREAAGREWLGRWPANLVLDEAAAAALGAQSGELTSGSIRTVHKRKTRDGWGMGGGLSEGDTGTAARMFFQSDWMAERLEAADAVRYVAKASTAEREAGLDPAQMRLMAQLYGDAVLDGVTPERAGIGALRDGGRDYVPDAFPETTVDDGRQTPIDNPYLRGETTRRNTHPTIKPISLARYLASLLLPPDLYAPRRMLVPFAGAGSEVIGAMLAGWEAIAGVELDAQHVAIANARIRYWSQRRHLLSQGRITTRAARPVAVEQESLL